jgi:hypothetical protein
MEVVKNSVCFHSRLSALNSPFNGTDGASVYTCPVKRSAAVSARRVEVRVFAANSGRIPSAEAEILQVSHLLWRLRGVVAVKLLIVRTAKVRLIVGSGTMRPYVRVLGEHRRGDGGKNECDTECLDFRSGHLGFLRFGETHASTFPAIGNRSDDPPTPLNYSLENSIGRDTAVIDSATQQRRAPPVHTWLSSYTRATRLERVCHSIAISVHAAFMARSGASRESCSRANAGPSQGATSAGVEGLNAPIEPSCTLHQRREHNTLCGGCYLSSEMTLLQT